MAYILIIDDDPEIRQLVTECLGDEGHVLIVADSLTEGRSLRNISAFDLVFLDVNLPDGSGLEAIADFKNSDSEPEVIIVTAEGKAEGAKMAFDYGAWDYILKPFTHHEIKLATKRALEIRASKKALKISSSTVFDRAEIIGNSPKLKMSLNLAAQCARSDASVLLTGQTGTGKELMAQTIHKNSNRKDGNFVVVDCAALPEQLVESVLFGNIKGAFTGADTSRDGLVKKADKGTLFLDEIGELPLSIQKKFLRVLQERSFKPVGGTKDIQSDFRLICATNRDLDEMSENEQFRRDLLFRIRTFHIELPPLCECREDIRDLTLYYIHRLCKRYGYEAKRFVPEFLDALEAYNWPGNIREFVSTMEKAILANPEAAALYPNYLPNQIRLEALKFSIGNQQNSSRPGSTLSQTPVSTLSIPLPDELFSPIKPLKQVKEYTANVTEERYLIELLKQSENNLDTASKLSCLSKSHLYSLLKKYSIDR